MEEIKMEYWKMNIWKVNEFNFLNETVEEFASRCSQNLVNIRGLAIWSNKPFNIVYAA